MEQGIVEVIGSFQMARRVVVLRIIHPGVEQKRMLSHVALWEVRQPHGQYRLFATPINGSPPWGQWLDDGFTFDRRQALQRLKDRHGRTDAT